MKKFLVILMVVAMASFLFVGCIPGVTPEPEPEPEPTPTPTPTTHAPIITTVPDAANGYVNKAEAADGIVVNGTGPTYSEIKLYIDGIFAGTGDVTATGAWTVDVAKTDLGADGDKVMYATAIEAGLAESDKSNEVKFTLDIVVPSIKSSSGKTGTVAAAAVTLDYQTLDGVPALTPNDTALFGAAVFDPAQLILGTVNWKIEVLTVIAPAGQASVRVTNLTAGTALDYTFTNTAIPFPGFVTTSTSWIPGATVTVSETDTTVTPGGGLDPTTDVGAYCLITTVRTTVVPGYIDVTFNESVTGVSILAGTWTAFGATVNILPAVTVRSATVARLTETNPAGLPNLVTGVAYSVSVSGIIDLAGNPIPVTAPSTTTGIVLP